MTVSATVTDQQGNTSAASSDSALIDLLQPTVTTTITEDANNDGIINASELSGNVNVDFALTNAVAGDTLTITNPDGTTTAVTLTAADITAGKYSTSYAVPAEGTTMTVSATVTDQQGNTSAASSDSALIGVIPPIVTPTTVRVSEEGLANGIPDNAGLNPADDTTNATTVTGNIATDPNGSLLTMSLSAPTQTITSGGNTVTWSGVGTNTLIGSANGVNILKISADSSGNYTVNLLGPVDHPNTAGEDTLSLTVGVTAKDAANNTASGNMTVVIEDDSPTAGNTTNTVTLPSVDTNVQLILDVSGSMGTKDVLDVYDLNNNGSTTDYISRLLAMKYAVNDMLTKYDTLGNVRVNVVKFSTEGQEVSTGWTTVANAKTIVQNLTSGGVTNYDEGLLSTMETFDSSGSIVGAQNVSYFLTDGSPYYSQHWYNRTSVSVQNTSATQDGIQPSEEVAWLNFLQTNNITSRAYVLGSGATLGNVNPIAYDGVNHTDTNGVLVPDISKLDTILRDTVIGSSSGSIVSGSTNIGFGADGSGNLTTLTLDGTTYTYDPVANAVTSSGGTNRGTFNAAAGELTIETNLGGKFVINVHDGTYAYTASGNQTGVSESINYALVDADGDPSGTGTLTLNIQASPATTPTIYTNTSAADQEIATDLFQTNKTTSTGDDWVHNNYIYKSVLNTGNGENLISTGIIDGSTINTGANNDRIYLLGSNNVGYSWVDLNKSTINTGAGNDIFYFDFNLNQASSTVKTSTIDMGTGKDILVFTQNNRTDFTFTNTVNGLQIKDNANTNVNFTVKNAEHIYFAKSNNSYNITNGQVNTGIVIDGIVKGIEYTTSSGLSGITRTDGSFDYMQGDTVTFKLGSVVIGHVNTDTITDGKVFLQDIAGTQRTDLGNTYVTNMAVLLQSLDNDHNADNGIVITDAMRQALSSEHFDLSKIDTSDLKSIIQTTGKESVDTDAAMQHVEKMLEKYGNLHKEDFQSKVETEKVEGKIGESHAVSESMPIVSVRSGNGDATTAMAVGAAVMGTYGTLVLAEDGSYVYTVDKEKAAKITIGDHKEDHFTYTFEDGTSKSITINVDNHHGSVTADAQTTVVSLQEESSTTDKTTDTTVSAETDADASTANDGIEGKQDDTQQASQEDTPDVAAIAGVLTFEETTIDFAKMHTQGHYQSVDLTKGGDHHIVHLTLGEVLDLTGGDKSLLIKTDNGDSVDLDGKWTQTGNHVFTAEDGTTVTIDGAGEVHYQKDATQTADTQEISKETSDANASDSIDTSATATTDSQTGAEDTTAQDTVSQDATSQESTTDQTTDNADSSTTDTASLDAILPETSSASAESTTTADTAATTPDTSTTDTASAAAIDPTVQVTVDDSVQAVA